MWARRRRREALVRTCLRRSDTTLPSRRSAEIEVKNFDHVVLFSDASMPMRRPFRKRKEALEHRRRIEAEALLPITLHFASTATNA